MGAPDWCRTVKLQMTGSDFDASEDERCAVRGCGRFCGGGPGAGCLECDRPIASGVISRCCSLQSRRRPSSSRGVFLSRGMRSS